MTELSAPIIILLFVTAQRLAELLHARRNEARLRAQGAIEHAAGHYGLIVALHAVWLMGLWLLAPGRPVSVVWLVVFALLQVMRVWVLATLKHRWTTRIIVLPNAPLVTDGPYRFLRHPNYAVVAAEMLVMPMVFGLFAFGIAFALANALILAVRIRAENRALENATASSLAPRLVA